MRRKEQKLGVEAEAEAEAEAKAEAEAETDMKVDMEMEMGVKVDVVAVVVWGRAAYRKLVPECEPVGKRSTTTTCRKGWEGR